MSNTPVVLQVNKNPPVARDAVKIGQISCNDQGRCPVGHPAAQAGPCHNHSSQTMG